MSKVSAKTRESAKNAANEPATDDIKQLAETPLQRTRHSSKMSQNRSGTEDSETDNEASRSQSRKRRLRRRKGGSSSNTRTPSSNNKDPLPEPVDRKFLVTPRFIKRSVFLTFNLTDQDELLIFFLTSFGFILNLPFIPYKFCLLPFKF